MPEVAGPAQRRLGPPYDAPDGQGATFVELFFDLVFVFALTEVTALTLHHLDWEGFARSVLIFWMIWWAWTQWTWALNPTDTNHGLIRLTALAATAVAFIMAASVGQAFGDDGGMWFAVPYVAVRVLGMALYFVVAARDRDQLSGVRMFTLASIPGMVVVLAGGLVDPELRAWLWLVAVVLDVAATGLAGSYSNWRLRADHFAERHGLFVIIALGESLIVVGLIVADVERSSEALQVAVGAVVVTCLLWWTYFGWLKDALEVQLEDEPRDGQAPLARDAYSLLHFPLAGGVIGIAIGFEEMVLHPGSHLETEAMFALALGLVLFVGAGAIAWLRAGRQLLIPRLGVLAALVVALVLAAEEEPVVVLAIIAVGIAVIAVLEQVMHPAQRIFEAHFGSD
jgi:low temperature requirement protein LtrA